MTFRNRISDGTKATAVVVILLMAMVGFFAGSVIQQVVVPGPERVRIVTKNVPGPTVTIPSKNAPVAATPTVTRTVTSAPTALPRATVTAPPRTVTRVTPGPTVTRSAPRVTVTTAPLVVVHCYSVALLGLIRIDCP